MSISAHLHPARRRCVSNELPSSAAAPLAALPRRQAVLLAAPWLLLPWGSYASAVASPDIRSQYDRRVSAPTHSATALKLLPSPHA